MKVEKKSELIGRGGLLSSPCGGSVTVYVIFLCTVEWQFYTYVVGHTLIKKKSKGLPVICEENVQIFSHI
jgi:hypothetical protein